MKMPKISIIVLGIQTYEQAQELATALSLKMPTVPVQASYVNYRSNESGETWDSNVSYVFPCPGVETTGNLSRAALQVLATLAGRGEWVLVANGWRWDKSPAQFWESLALWQAGR